MKNYLPAAAALVFAAGLAFAARDEQSTTPELPYTGPPVPSIVMPRPSPVEKTFEGSIVWVRGAVKENTTGARIYVKGTSGKPETFIVGKSTMIEGKDQTSTTLSSLHKAEKVMVTYHATSGKNVAESIVVES